MLLSEQLVGSTRSSQQELWGQGMDTLVAERLLISAETPVGEPRRRVRWVAVIIVAVVGALFVLSVTALINQQVSERRQFNSAEHALGVIRSANGSATHDAAVLRQVITKLKTQVRTDSVSLQQDEAQLSAVQAALTFTQADVSQQTTRLAALHVCMGGVQQALNALALADPSSARFDLGAVSSSCASALGG